MGDSKLTDKQVVAIREAIVAGTHGPLELAQQYGVSRQTIHNIARHKAWKSAGGPKYGTKPGPQTSTGYWG